MSMQLPDMRRRRAPFVHRAHLFRPFWSACDLQNKLRAANPPGYAPARASDECRCGKVGQTAVYAECLPSQPNSGRKACHDPHTTEQLLRRLVRRQRRGRPISADARARNAQAPTHGRPRAASTMAALQQRRNANKKAGASHSPLRNERTTAGLDTDTRPDCHGGICRGRRREAGRLLEDPHNGCG